MASADLSPQASTPANTRRKTSRISLDISPLRPLSPWDAKMDALGHCYEGDVAEHRRKTMSKGLAETFLAKQENDSTRQTRASELKNKIGASRDKLMADLRLLVEARSKLNDVGRDFTSPCGKEKLTLGEIVHISDEMCMLWRREAENHDLERINETLAQRDEMRNERDGATRSMWTAKAERDTARKERESYRTELDVLRSERDTLLQERDRFRKESEMKDREYRLLRETELTRQVQFNDQQEAALRSTEAHQVALQDVEKERDHLRGECDRYRDQRNSFYSKCDSLRGQRLQSQDRVKELEGELKGAKMRLADDSKRFENELRRQRTSLQGEHNKMLQGERKCWGNAHDTIVRDLNQYWEQENSRLTASISVNQVTIDEMRATARATEDQHYQAIRKLNHGWEQEKSRLTASVSVSGEKIDELTVTAKTKKDQHDRAIGGLTRALEAKAALVSASQVTIDDLVATANSTAATHAATLQAHLNRLSLLMEINAKDRRAIRGLVIALAVSLSSYNKMHNAFLMRGGTINNGNSRIKALDERLTDLQVRNDTSTSESSNLRKELHGKREEIDGLRASSEVNLEALRTLQDVHAVGEHEQRLQLGRIDRNTFFEDFSKFAESLSEKGRVFSGKENGRHVDVCFCVLQGSNEAMCVIGRSGGAFTIWHSKLEDCSMFNYTWDKLVVLRRKWSGQATLYMFGECRRNGRMVGNACYFSDGVR